MLVIAVVVIPVLINFNTKAEVTSWSTVSPMPTARGGLGVAVVEGKIYAIGGINGNGPINTTEVYNPTTDKWSTLSSMPTARTGLAIAVYNNKIYAIGGSIGNGYVGNNEVYDPQTNSWQTKASMPTPRADLSAAMVGDKIYLIGGRIYSNTDPYFTETNKNEVYDPVTDSWATKSPIPTSIQGYSAAILDNKVHIIGGSKSGSSILNGTYITQNQIYDPKKDTWNSGNSLPTSTAYASAVTTAGFMAPQRIYLFGGYFGSSFSAKTQVFNPSSNTWSEDTDMPTARVYSAAAVVDDIIYVMGGFDGDKWLNTNEKYLPQGYGTAPPKIEILTPENKTYTDVTVSFTTNRPTSWTGYSVDNQANITVTGQIQLTGLSQGGHSLIIYGNDSAGNMGASNQIFFSVDTIGPNIIIIYPKNQSYSSTDVQLTFTIDEPVKYLAYSLDGQEKIEIVGNVTLPALSEGSHHLTIYATDEVGNSASETVFFSIALFPMITVVAILTIITIVLAASYLFIKRRKRTAEIKNAE